MCEMHNGFHTMDLKDMNLSKFLGDIRGQEGLAGYSPWGHKE